MALVLQTLLWELIHPFAWLLFFPAVLVAAWLGGLSAGLVATVLSAALAWYFFIPPELSVLKHDPKYLLPLVLFTAAGVLFSTLYHRLKRADRRLSDSEARLRALVAASADIVWTTDADGAVVEDLPPWRAFTGQSRDEVKQFGWLEALHPDDRERSLELWRGSVNSGTPFAGEYRIRHVSGEWRWTAVRASPLRRADGSVHGWVGMNTDITERRRAEEALRLSEAKYSGIVTISADAIICVDENQRITIFNEGAEATFGYTSAQAIGAPLDILIPERFRAAHRRHVQKFAAGQVISRRMGERNVAIVGLRKDGREFPAEAAISKLAVGGATLLTVALRDVSERKELERLREEWSSIVAHDLRQPAAIISLAVELLSGLRKGEVTERERKTFERVRGAARRLETMIGDLLDASILEVGRLSLQCRTVELISLVHGLVGDQQETMAGHQVRVDAAAEELVWGDPDRLQQVLGNLLSNAVKYGLPGTEVGVEVIGNSDVVEVVVANRGRGIPPEELPFLFSRFARTRDARVGRTSGLGLGLYIAKGLVEAHGGRIWAESAPGEVTRFHFTVPRAPGVLRGPAAK